jgi:acyl-CoA thioesterase-2
MSLLNTFSFNTMSQTKQSPGLKELLQLLDLEPIEANMFRGYHPRGRTHRLFGGQIIAQALMAAGQTVPVARIPHSLHGYFLLPGDPGVPALFKVERIRDGKSFTTRNVVVVQHGNAIFSMTVSFQQPEVGLEHQFPMPDLKPPSTRAVSAFAQDDAFVSWRHDHKRLLVEKPQPPLQHIWIRTNGPVPDDPLLNTCLIVYESDNALLSTTRLPHRGNFKRDKMQGASLDHAMWFHHPVRADQWLLYSMDSPSAASARGFNRGSIFTADGKLVMSAMQEGLIRIRP